MYDGVKLLLEEVLYKNKENEKYFPRGSIIAGFRGKKNLGEIIAPIRALQEVNFIVSRYDGVNVKKRLDYSTPRCNNPVD